MMALKKSLIKKKTAQEDRNHAPKRNHSHACEEETEKSLPPALPAAATTNPQTSFASPSITSAPANKRRKNQHDPGVNNTVSLEYPTVKEIGVPRKALIEMLVKETTSMFPEGEQASITNAGLLSFSQVILPSILCQHDHVLKQLDQTLPRKQRASSDADFKDVVFHGRRVSVQAMGAAMRVAEATRQQRMQSYAHMQRLAKQKRKENRAEEAKFKAMQLEHERPQAIRAARKKFPANQAMYREQAFLMGELVRLEAEDKNWQNVGSDLEKKRCALQSDLDQKIALINQVGQETNDVSLMKQNLEKSPVAEIQVKVLQQELDTMKMTAQRVQSALDIVQKLVVKAEEIRFKLFQDFTKKEYAGYPGIKQPRQLIKALTQSQTQNSQDSD